MKTKALVLERLEDKNLMAAMDWGFTDPELSTYMNTTALTDSRLSREEMICALRLTTDGGIVDQREYNDLRNIVYPDSFYSLIRLPYDLRGVARHIFENSDNRGKELRANSPASEMNRLIDKWFLGQDRPAIKDAAAYRPVAGSLFVDGPSHLDVNQGRVGDCYFMAALASVADKDPSSIVNSIIPNNDNTWTVLFVTGDTKSPSLRFSERGGRWVDYIVVDNMLPVDKTSGYAFYAGFGHKYDDSRNELWVALIEKAYAQWNETDRTKQGNWMNSYAGISGGWSHVVYTQLFLGGSVANTYQSGNVSSGFDFSKSFDKLVDALRSGKAVCVYRFMDAARTTGHAYYLQSYSAETGKFALSNPWGYGDLSQSFSELTKSCYGYSICSLKTSVKVLPGDLPPNGGLKAKTMAFRGMATDAAKHRRSG